MTAGRPKLDAQGLVPLGVKVRPEEKDALEEYAERNELTDGAVVRLALRQFLGLPEIPEKKIN